MIVDIKKFIFTYQFEEFQTWRINLIKNYCQLLNSGELIEAGSMSLNVSFLTKIRFLGFVNFLLLTILDEAFFEEDSIVLFEGTCWPIFSKQNVSKLKSKVEIKTKISVLKSLEKWETEVK